MEPKEPDIEADPPRDEDPAAAMLRRFKEDQARRVAEQKARGAEANRQREAEQREREEQERARVEAERIRRLEEEARKKEAEARQREEEERLREAELARRQAEGERITLEAEAKALKDQRAKESAARLRQDVAVRPREPEPRRGAPAARGRRVVKVLFVLLTLGLVALHIVPFDGSSFELAASTRLGMPVKIASTHFSTLPLPALRFKDVTIGAGGEAKIAAVTVKAGLRTLLDSKKHFEVIELDGAQIPLSWFAAALWNKGGNAALHVDRVVAHGLKLQAPGLDLPAFNMDAKMDAAGAVHSMTAETPNRAQTFGIAVTDGKGAFRYSAKPFTLPFGGTVKFDDFAGTGTLTPAELAFDRFDATLFEGSLSGSARLRWAAGWSLDGDFAARSMNPARVAGRLVPTGRLDGKGTFAMRAATPEKLVDSARVDTTFTVHRGTLGFVDLARHIQGGAGRGGTTAFEKMDGAATLSAGELHLRKVRLDAGLLRAIGDGVVDPQSNLNARFQIELTPVRGPLALGGTVASPQVKP